MKSYTEINCAKVFKSLYISMYFYTARVTIVKQWNLTLFCTFAVKYVPYVWPKIENSMKFIIRKSNKYICPSTSLLWKLYSILSHHLTFSFFVFFLLILVLLFWSVYGVCVWVLVCVFVCSCACMNTCALWCRYKRTNLSFFFFVLIFEIV